MATYPIAVPGLPDGELNLRQGVFAEPRFYLGGKRLKAKRGAVDVPVGASTVNVRLAGGWWRSFQEPTVLVGESKLVLAPRLPTLLVVASMLPLMLLLAGAFGGAVAALACMANVALARQPWTMGARVAAVVAVTVSTIGAYVVFAVSLLA